MCVMYLKMSIVPAFYFICFFSCILKFCATEFIWRYIYLAYFINIYILVETNNVVEQLHSNKIN